MNQDDIVKAVAQVAALPLRKRNLLTNTSKVRYGVMMTYPYFLIVREEDGSDLFFTFNAEEAQEYAEALRAKNALCEYDVLTLCKHYEF